jgi:ELWxxDGT repeat protein
MFLSSWFAKRTRPVGPSRKNARAARLGVEPLEDRTLLSAYLVKDINVNTVSSNPSNLTNINGTLFFSATDNDGSTGLWRSDGTAAGTTLVREFPGLDNFVNVNGELFFDVVSNQAGRTTPTQLWKSDGTARGTALVKDFTGQGLLGSGSGAVVSFQDRLYFSLADTTFPNNEHLWASDGTAAGTVPVDPGAFTIGPFNPGFTVLGSRLYFIGNDPTNGTRLWKTDGSDLSTQIADGDIPNVGVEALTAANGALYFFAVHDATFQTVDLFRSDGTHTTLVQTGFANFGDLEIAGAGGKLFFTAAPASNFFTEGLWVSDGTPAGTRELNPANVSPYGLNPFFLHAVNGRVVFNGSSATHPFFGEGIWTSDGTDAGTVEITPAGLAGGFVELGATALSGNTLYFGTVDQLWQTDGTAAGTTLVVTIQTPAIFLNGPENLTLACSTLFFTINDGTHGDELWSSNGTAAGTELVKDINTNTIGSFPSFLTDANGTLFFTADDSPAAGFNFGPEIWKSDGTTAGTQLVSTPSPLSYAFPANLTNVNGTVFFTEVNGPPQLWTVSATAGPQLVMDFSKPNDFISGPDNLTAVGNTLFFTLIDNNSGEEDLWQSDGTAAGTHVVRTNVLLLFGSGVAAGGKFFFVGVDPSTFAEQLWESDGSAAGTHIVDASNPGANVFGLSNVNGTLYYFDLGPNFNDLTFWKSDGTTNTEVADFSNGTDFVSALPPINVKGTAYFFVIDSTTSTGELWTSDGTPAGTLPVAAVQPDVTFDNRGNAVADAVLVGGRLFFTATDPLQGEQLWVSDGTPGGTRVVSNITQGNHFGQPVPFDLTAFDGRLFFVASDPTHGTELWSSNGTPASTELVQDINPGPAGSAPSQLTVVGHTLFFAATDLAHGTELWAYRPGKSSQGTAAADLPGADSLTQQVAYPVAGFMLPLPVTDFYGNALTALSAVQSIQMQPVSAVGQPLAAPFTPSDPGSSGLQNDGTQSSFNWQTKGLSAGYYDILDILDDGTVQTIEIQLVPK